MLKLFSIDVTLVATAYIKAETAEEAADKLEKLESSIEFGRQ